MRAKKNQRRLVRTHSKASDIYKDTIHEASYRAATTYAIKIFEHLDVGGMGQQGQGKRGFNDARYDAALGEFRRQLTYKCTWHHRSSGPQTAGARRQSSAFCVGCKMRVSYDPQACFAASTADWF